MNRPGEVAFHAVAAVALLAHVLVVGPLSLLALYLRPEPGTEGAALVLKVLIAGAWFGLGLAGIRSWRSRSWAVVGVPFVSFSIAWLLVLVGNETIRWTLGFGY